MVFNEVEEQRAKQFLKSYQYTFGIHLHGLTESATRTKKKTIQESVTGVESF